MQGGLETQLEQKHHAVVLSVCKKKLIQIYTAEGEVLMTGLLGEIMNIKRRAF